MFPVLLNDSLFIIVGTPYRDNDVIISTMRKHGVREVAGEPLPKRYAAFEREDGRWDLYHMPAQNADGNPTLPSIWTREDIDGFRADDVHFYASQLLLQPGSGKLQILSIDDIENMIVDTFPRGFAVSMHMDTAIKDSDKIGKGDDNVILIVVHHPTSGEIWFVDAAVSNEWTIDDFNRYFVEMIRKWQKKRRCRIKALTDDGAIGGKGNAIWRSHLEGLCREHGLIMPHFIPINRAGKRKAIRISEAAAHWVAGRVKVWAGMPHKDKLIEQMSLIDVSQFDDMADAGADAFHEDIYRPATKIGVHEQPPRVRLPFDEVLKSRFSNDDARRAYDNDVPLSELPEEECPW